MTPPLLTLMRSAGRFSKRGAPILSSVMGLFPPSFVQEIKGSGAAWFAVVSTLAEARAAEAAGADVIVAQGSEAGGHRAAFDPAEAERRMVGLFSLLTGAGRRIERARGGYWRHCGRKGRRRGAHAWGERRSNWNWLPPVP